MPSALRFSLAGAALLLSLGILGIPPASGARVRPYRFVDLGLLPGGTFSAGIAINARGEVAGSARLGDGSFRAFRWRVGRMTALEPLAGGVSSFGYALNNRGDVFGASQAADGRLHAAVRWHGEAPEDLGLPRSGSFVAGQAFGGSDKGLAAGSLFTAAGGNQAATWFRGRAAPLRNRAGVIGSLALAVNARAVVAGRIEFADRNFHAALWHSRNPRDLGTLGGANSVANAINARGAAAGSSELRNSAVTHAWLWQHGRMMDLGAPAGQSSEAFGINRAGQVVGSAGDTALLWDHGAMIDLNTAAPLPEGTRLEFASAINDRGEITGGASSPGGNSGFLLTNR